MTTVNVSLREAISRIAGQAFTMGRSYTRDGEKETPAEMYDCMKAMIDRELQALAPEQPSEQGDVGLVRRIVDVVLESHDMVPENCAHNHFRNSITQKITEILITPHPQEPPANDEAITCEQCDSPITEDVQFCPACWNDLARRANANDEAVRLRVALQKIKDEEGQVCDNYELCDHRACQSSYRAWAIADAALTTHKQEGKDNG